MASASAAELMCGTISPCAPPSSTRAARWPSCEPMRTIGVMPALIAATHSIDAVSSEVGLCSRST
jgi:hypothetical protein